MGDFYLFFAYVGPDVALPLASVLAGVIGFIMMVGRAPFRFAARGFRSAARGVRALAKGDRPPGDSTPQAP